MLLKHSLHVLLMLVVSCGSGNGGIVDNGHEEDDDDKRDKAGNEAPTQADGAENSFLPENLQDVSIFDIWTVSIPQTYVLQELESGDSVRVYKNDDSDQLTFSKDTQLCSDTPVVNAHDVAVYTCDAENTQFYLSGKGIVRLKHQLATPNLQVITDSFREATD